MAQALNNSMFENGILSAPIQLSINGLLYLYNKCNDNLHLLIISYSLVRGVMWRILLWVSDYIYKINIKFSRKCLISIVFGLFLIFYIKKANIFPVTRVGRIFKKNMQKRKADYSTSPCLIRCILE